MSAPLIMKTHYFPILAFTHLALLSSAIAADTMPPLAPGLTAKNPVSLLPDDLKGAMKFRDDSGIQPPATAVWSNDVELRVENFARPKFPDQVSANWSFSQPAKRGDVVLARFFARAEYARQESGEADFEFTVKQDQPTYAAL